MLIIGFMLFVLSEINVKQADSFNGMPKIVVNAAN